MIMFVIAIVLVIGMLILGVPYGIFRGIGIAILDFLPMFGTGTALIPWAVVKLFTGEYGACGRSHRTLCPDTGDPPGDPAEDRRCMGLPAVSNFVFPLSWFQVPRHRRE